MPVRKSGAGSKPYAENYRAHELPAFDPAAAAAPDRDPTTGRFSAGNAVSRRRKLIKVARSLPWLDPAACEPWLRPYVLAAKSHAVDLLAELPPGDPLVSSLAEELAGARVVYRALMARGLEGDPTALEAARAWLREARQHALALEGIRRKVEPEEPANATPPWLVKGAST